MAERRKKKKVVILKLAGKTDIIGLADFVFLNQWVN
tara:strand:+ start:348 stop:455 length:108 start_codon:yes stop_codon:yes gene_type:complete